MEALLLLPTKYGSLYVLYQGISKAACNIYQELRENHLLDCYSEERIIFTGHSLGGGVAILLSRMLQKDYPNICVAFSPPGQTIIDDYDDNLYDIIVGNDIIPRFTKHSIYLWYSVGI